MNDLVVMHEGKQMVSSQLVADKFGKVVLYELLATVCGIEPSSPGFSRVRIEPHPGKLKFVEGVMPHPRGIISCSLRRQGSAGIAGEIILPEGLAGDFFWQGKKLELKQGKQTINLR